MILSAGDKVHIITRRLFEGDLRRHFAGIVENVAGDLVIVGGYAFIFDANANEYVRLPERRRRVFGLSSPGLIVNLIPKEVAVENLVYQKNRSSRLMVTDNAGFALDINEFGVRN